MRLPVLLLGLLSLAGCATEMREVPATTAEAPLMVEPEPSPAPLSFNFDGGTPEEFALATEAAASWMETCPNVRITVTYKMGVGEIYLRAVDEIERSEGGQVVGRTDFGDDGRPRVVLFVSGRSREKTLRTLKHEIGHVLGRGHEHGGIMVRSSDDDAVDALVATDCPPTVAR